MTLHTDARGSIELGRSGDLVTSKVTGYLSLGLAQHILAEMKQAIAATGRVRVAHDWYEMTNYEGEVRAALTTFTLSNRKAVGEVWILLKSPMVSMGVNTAAIALRAVGITINSTTAPDVFRAQFEALTRKAA